MRFIITRSISLPCVFVLGYLGKTSSKFFIFTRCYLLVLCSASASAYAVELPELLLAARERDPTCAIARAQMVAASARTSQARAELFPTLNFTGSTLRSNYDQDFPVQQRFWTNQWALQLSQPLLRPANYFSLTQAQKQEAQAVAQLAQAESDLADRLISAWFDVLNNQEVLRAVLAQKDATRQQLISAKRSFEVGSVSIADVREAEAKHSLVIAQEVQVESELMLKREVLSQLTSRPIAELDAGLWMKPMLNDRLGSMEGWIKDTRETNPILVQARYQLDASLEAIKKEESAYAPTMDFVVNDTRYSATGSAYTDNPSHNQTLQVGVQVNVPLFSGLSTSAKVREAKALRDKSLGERDQAGDEVASRVKQAYFGLRGALMAIPVLEIAQTANNVAVQANQRGYQVGMRTNVDVLNALAQLYQTDKDLAKARTDAWLNYIRLRVLTGQWTEADLHAF